MSPSHIAKCLHNSRVEIESKDKMHTTFAFLTKNPALTTDEFIAYYETKHVPLINRLAGPENQPLVYKRRYTHRDDPSHIVARAKVDGEGRPVEETTTAAGDLGAGEEGKDSAQKGQTGTADDAGLIDFDVITELGFADKDGQKRWMEALGRNGGNLVAEDEARFLWRERTRAVAVSEFVSFGA